MVSLSVKRHELKYYINQGEASLMAHRLSHLLHRDPHSTPLQGYRIKSLYFDTPDNRDLNEKLSGYICRKKIRLRIYDEAAKQAKLEVKYKRNQQIDKRSALLPRTIALRVQDGDYSALLEANQPDLPGFYGMLAGEGYRPVVIVEYWREAFTYPAFNIRITLDRHLSGNTSQLNLFKKNEGAVPMLLSGRQILEVKFNGYLPEHIRRILHQHPLERMAISKYTIARRYDRREKWEDN